MRKYPCLNYNGPYDTEKILKLCFNIPSLIRDTYIYQDKLIALLGNEFKTPLDENMYREQLELTFVSCIKLETFIKEENNVVQKIKNIYSDLCSISNINQQMGAYYLFSSALPLFTNLAIQHEIKDPKTFILLAPKITKLTILLFNIMTTNCYSSRKECERLESMNAAEIGLEKKIYWHNGANVTLVYAVSRLKAGSIVMDIGPYINETFDSITALVLKDDILWNTKPSFIEMVNNRRKNIKSIYSIYTSNEIGNASNLSAIKNGRLPFDDEIKKALLS